jgi:poly(3-hydroxybutyrate) depolymerase
MQGIDQVCQLHPVDSTRVAIAGLSAGASMAALLVTVSRLAHAWSGGAANKPFSDAKGPDASRMVWAFAARQFRV